MTENPYDSPQSDPASADSAKQIDSPDSVVPKRFLFPFILVTSLFALWGFANDITNPLVKAFGDIFQIDNAQSAWVQRAFYGGYATMAIPAALVLRSLSYKWGIVIGLSLYAIGALIFIPASWYMQFSLFLVALYILTFGLAFLETAANPYILSMGPPETATRRLNLAQAFNPIGSLTGMMIAALFILPNLTTEGFRAQEKAAHPEYASMLPGDVDGKLNDSLKAFSVNNADEFAKMQEKDLQTVRLPYVVIAVVVLLVLVMFVVSKMPDTGAQSEDIELGALIQKLLQPRYIGGVIAQAFYVGAQIMCWTYIIHYGVTLCGLDAGSAQQYNIVAMVTFLLSRFVCTFLLKFVNPGLLLGILSIVAMVLIYFVVTLQNMSGLYCLVAVSACMSLMFPTIYGIALQGLTPEDAKLGSAGLIFAIVGGALMPPWQGELIDAKGGSFIEGIMNPLQNAFGADVASTASSFVLPFLCFIVIAIYGFATSLGSRRPARA